VDDCQYGYITKLNTLGLMHKQWLQTLWPDGIFLTKHPNRHGSSTNSGAPKEGVELEGVKKAGQRVQQQAPVNSFEHHLEALRRAMVVREILLGKTQDASLPLIIYIYIYAEVFSLEKLFVGSKLEVIVLNRSLGFANGI
jgi:hypothetical protein